MENGIIQELVDALKSAADSLYKKSCSNDDYIAVAYYRRLVGDVEGSSLASCSEVLDSCALLTRLDGCRGMYFHSWLLGEWANDPKRLQHVSVTEIICRYDQYCESRWSNDRAPLGEGKRN